jgi:hypothetical protein
MARIPNTAEYGSEPNSVLKKVGAGIRSKYDVTYVRLIFLYNKSAPTAPFETIRAGFLSVFRIQSGYRGFDDKKIEKKFTVEKKFDIFL